jgi:hypothetical protein
MQLVLCNEFLNFAMVLVPSPASWQNRSDGINTIVRLKVLTLMTD